MAREEPGATRWEIDTDRVAKDGMTIERRVISDGGSGGGRGPARGRC